MYRIDIMTLFPDVVGDMLCESILGRGQERGYIRIECHTHVIPKSYSEY